MCGAAVSRSFRIVVHRNHEHHVHELVYCGTEIEHIDDANNGHSDDLCTCSIECHKNVYNITGAFMRTNLSESIFLYAYIRQSYLYAVNK